MIEAIKEILVEDNAINEKIKEGFKIITAKTSGKLDLKGLEKVMNRISVEMGVEPPKSQDLEEVFKGIDKDNDGTIDYKEFSKLIKDVLSSIIRKEEEENENDEDDIDI